MNRCVSVIASVLMCSAVGLSQLSGPKAIPGDYATIAAAITDLNTQGVGAGGVTFNVAAGHTETSSNMVIAIGANQPTAANPVVFQKSGAGANPLITAAPGVSTNLDAVIKLSGADYITFDGINILDPPSNNTFTTMMEQGIALLRASSTDGSQHITIKNCTITLQKANVQSSTVFSTGIFVANRDTNGTTVNATNPTGLNSYNRIFGNTISNVVVGIRFLGPLTAGQRDFDNEIGVIGEAPNTITDFAGSGTTANAEGIRIEGQMNVKVNNNIISGGLGHTYIMYGILITTGGSNPGAGSYEIAYNTVTLLSSPSSYTQYAIRALANGDTVRIHHNTVENSNVTATTTASFWGIAHDPVGSPGSNLSLIHDNIIRNNTLGGTTGVMHGVLAGGSGTMQNLFVHNNQVYGNQKTGSGSLYGILGGAATITCHSNAVYNNSSAGSLYGYFNNASGVTGQTVYNNLFYTLSGGTATYGIYANTSSSTNTAPKNVYGNTVHSVSSTGGSAVGIYHQYGGVSQYYGNNIYNVSTTASDTSSFAAGIVLYNVLSTSSATVYNNFISDIRAPNSNNRNGVVGINGIGSSSGSSIAAYYNTIYLNAPAGGSNFGSSGISVVGSTSATNAPHDLRNNIVVNLSTPGATGVTTALRRITNASLNNYSLNSNNNDYYAGSPSSNRLIYYFDAATSDQTIAEFQGRVTPREGASFSAMPPFVNSTTAPFDLHIQTATATPIESGGMVISAITTDIDGNLRFGAPGYGGNGTAPDVGADELEGTPLAPMVYVSSTTTQNTNAVFANSVNNHIIGIEVVTTGFSNPLMVTEFSLNTNGSTNAAGDITNAKVFYTGSIGTFGTTVLFGSTASPPPAPSTYTITGSQALVSGTNYFWLTYDIPSSATGGNVVDGEVLSVTIDGTPRIPSITAPAGNRVIITALSGTYTISPAQPYPYNSFGNVAAVLGSAGVAGPVTFNVQPGSGPYNEQVEFTAIPGASSTNTVTINGNGETITYMPDATDRHVVRLNGAQWMTLNNLTIIGTDTLYGWGIHFMNAANHNTINNCTIDLSSGRNTSLGTYTLVGIVATASTTSISTAGNNANYCTFSGNSIQGGPEGGPQIGIRINGNTGGLNAVGNQFVNNTVRDFHEYGMHLLNTDSTLVSGNNIHRANRLTVTIFRGLVLGTGCRNTLIEKNRIHTTNAPTANPSATAYGIHFDGADAPVGSENVAVNNMLYKFNSVTGIIWAIYNLGADGAHCYFNSISLDDTDAVGGTSTTRGFYQTTTASNIVFRNNIVSITRGGGSTKHCLYFGSAGSTITSNNNLLYINAPAGTNYTGFLSTNYATLANWQTTGHDLNSVEGDPLFLAIDNLHINTVATPASPASNAGAPIAGITTDFDDDPRDLVTPDIGADEFDESSGVLVGVNLAEGWNLISNPVVRGPNTDSVLHLFPTSSFSYVFAFVPGGGYVQEYVMPNGPGFWGKFPAATVNNITGGPLTSYSVNVQTGWNIVGSLSGPVDTSSITSTPPGLRASSWFGYNNGYAPVTVLVPGLAYWVKTNGVGQFHFTSPSPAGRTHSVSDPLEQMNSITITDSRGGSQTLYFGVNDGLDARAYVMPPLPPQGAFDARFAGEEGGRMVQVHGPNIGEALVYPIDVRSTAYPVTVSWSIVRGEYELLVAGSARSMSSTGTLVIQQPGNLSVRVLSAGAEIPTSFALEQNYPNPFNPSTSIRFAMPVAGRVDIEVFNILGQRVSILLAKEMTAGYHVVQWDGTSDAGQPLGGGVYFVRMKADEAIGGFTEVRKVMFLK